MRTELRRGILGWILLAMSCSAQTAPQEPLATVAGQPIYEEELAPLIQAQMRKVLTQEYEIKSKALEKLIEQKLLRAEADRKGILPQKLLEQEVNSKVPEPSDAEVEAYYLAQKDRLKRPLHEVKVQLRSGLKRARLEQTRQDYFKQLREKASVAILLRPPKTDVAYDTARLRGNPEAPVTIVEFSDFQCPYCRTVQLTLTTLLSKYGGRVKLAFRDFPLRRLHPQAQKAAEASRCAAEQGKYWEYHDLLFANPSALDTESLSEHARTLGLNGKQFDSCLAGSKYAAKIERDLAEGRAAGVSGTPGFFVNGVFLGGAQPISAFEKIIEAELQAIGRERLLKPAPTAP
jgi:protein-disulfide isomerase